MAPLLIDGHNIIGSGVLQDISLEDEDDEQRFVSRLRVWRSTYRGNITVVFDRGIVGGSSRELSGAGVDVIFARDPQEADDLIRRRIHKRMARLIVVTNDWALRKEAELYDVETWQAEEFVQRMERGRSPTGRRDDPRQAGGSPASGEADAGPDDEGAESHVNLSGQEVNEWMDLFGPPKPAPKRQSPAARRPQNSNRTAFSRDQEALRKRLQGKRRRR